MLCMAYSFKESVCIMAGRKLVQDVIHAVLARVWDLELTFSAGQCSMADL